MPRENKPIPPDFPYADTLARRVSQLREFRNMTVKDLARSARFTIERVEDIESGLETWLSVTDRQVLAKGLGVDPYRLQEVERRVKVNEINYDAKTVGLIIAGIVDAILRGARDLECPDCGGTLKCSIQEGIDMELRPIKFAKAFCVKCPFILRY